MTPRSLLRSLLLPLLLLLAQQGALLHELSHYAKPQTQEEGGDKKQPSHAEACSLCLAFAQVESAAPTHVSMAPLLAQLSFELTPVDPVYVATTPLPAERSRGPPPIL